MGRKDDNFCSKIGSGFGEPGAHPHQEFPGMSIPPPSLPLSLLPLYGIINTKNDKNIICKYEEELK